MVYHISSSFNFRLPHFYLGFGLAGRTPHCILLGRGIKSRIIFQAQKQLEVWWVPAGGTFPAAKHIRQLFISCLLLASQPASQWGRHPGSRWAEGVRPGGHIQDKFSALLYWIFAICLPSQNRKLTYEASQVLSPLRGKQIARKLAVCRKVQIPYAG